MFIGRPVIEKGLNDLLNALSILDNYNWELSIVGEFPKEINLNDFPYKKRVHKIGALPNSEIPMIMNNHQIIIVPSHYENFGNVVIEGLACGLMIIASETGGIKDIIKNNHNGMLFTPKNHQHLASRLEIIFDNPKQIKVFSKNALICSKQYDWKYITKKTIKLFNDFL